MKQIRLMNQLAGISAFIFVTLFAASCSSDAFFGFDDDSFDSISSGGNCIKNVINPSDLDCIEFLDLTNLSLPKMTKEDLEILDKAEARLNITIINGVYNIREKSGSEINISERLFKFIISNFEKTNIIMRETAQTKVKRSKSGNGEVIISNDCVAYAISYMCELDYSTVNSWLSATFGQVYAQGGVPFDFVPYAVRHFRPTAYSHSSYPTGGLFNSNTLSDGVMVINGINSNNYHAVNAQSYHEPGALNSNHIVRYYDSMDGRGGTLYILSNNIPSYDLSNNKVVHMLVY